MRRTVASSMSRSRCSATSASRRAAPPVGTRPGAEPARGPAVLMSDVHRAAGTGDVGDGDADRPKGTSLAHLDLDRPVAHGQQATLDHGGRLTAAKADVDAHAEGSLPVPGAAQRTLGT